MLVQRDADIARFHVEVKAPVAAVAADAAVLHAAEWGGQMAGNLGVDPDHAHQGIGRAVSVAAINYLVAKGLKHSMLYVDADNEKGLALYTSLGFN